MRVSEFRYANGWLGLKTDDPAAFRAVNLEPGDYDIVPHKAKRNNDQNAYFHVLVNEIARVTGQSDTDVKRRLNLEYGTLARDEYGKIVGAQLPVGVNPDSLYPYFKAYKGVEIDGKSYLCYLAYKRTSELNTAEFAKLMDGTISEAKELGIDTDTPEEKARYEE